MRSFLVFLCICVPFVAKAQMPFGYPHADNSVRPLVLDDVELSARIRNPAQTIFYKLPPVWQRFNGTLSDYEWGVYPVSVDPESHANLDFPWEGTVGLNSLVKAGELHTDTINFVSLPLQGDGRPYPIVVLHKIPVVWIFPVGTIVGEIIYTRHKQQWWPQELRARVKGELSVVWDPLIYRPLASRSDLETILGQRIQNPAKKWFHFRNPEEDLVFEMEGLVERLPIMDPTTVERILSLPFKEVTYERWSDISHAPASDQAFNIFPKDYSFGLIDPDPTNCASCHRQTQVSVAQLIPREPTLARQGKKIGNIRGSDGIFSWHPFATIKGLVKGGSGLKVRKFDVENGFVHVHKRGQPVPDPSIYKLTEYVENEMQYLALPEETSLRHSR